MTALGPTPSSIVRDLARRVRDRIRPPALRFPYGGYLVSDRHRFVYRPIPKNAATTLTAWVLEAEGTPSQGLRGREIHARALRLVLRERDPREARRILENYFSFVFVRNPWDRLVSAYLGMFVRQRTPLPITGPVVEAVGRSLGRPLAGPDQLAFRQFVEYVCAMPDAELDPHWRPQSCFVTGHTFDFVGRVERIDEDLPELGRRLGIEPPKRARNRTRYAPALADRGYADVPAAELRPLPGLPRPAQMYTSDLADRVQQRYREDVETWGYFAPRPKPIEPGGLRVACVGKG
jgi:hypothetical protein